MLSWLFFGGKIVCGLILTLTVALYMNQEKLLYHPNPPGTPKTPEENPDGCRAPSEWNKKGFSVYDRKKGNVAEPIPYEDAMVETADGEKIHTWLLLQDDSHNVPTLIYFHGNAANMGFRLQNAADMYGISKLNILMMDYRGFGKSSGVPTESGLQLDGEAVLDYALNHPKLRNSPIVVFGRSLGGAVSIYLAEKFPHKVAAVIVENTFLSIGAMVDVLMPFLTPLKPYVLKINWDSENKIQHIKQPTLFISGSLFRCPPSSSAIVLTVFCIVCNVGDSDQLVPPVHMKKLYDLAVKSSRREMYSVSGGTHNDTWYRAGFAYYQVYLYPSCSFIVPSFMSSCVICPLEIEGVLGSVLQSRCRILFVGFRDGRECLPGSSSPR